MSRRRASRAAHPALRAASSDLSHLLPRLFCRSDFSGYLKATRNTLAIYPTVYGAACIGIHSQQLPPPGYAETYENNTCILAAGEPVLALSDYVRVASDPLVFRQQLALGGNTIYATNGDARVAAKGANFTLYVDFVAAGFDSGSVVRSDVPDGDTLLIWARALLDAYVGR